mmetsp:Transcript_27710/g.54403  ORF Transcript_27710/g.54403 Transcript_27710/m.54403 type:complete len:141 (-) Transcript_27710:132-554(-)
MKLMLLILRSSWAFSNWPHGSTSNGITHAEGEEYPVFLLQQLASLEPGRSDSCPPIAPAEGKKCGVIAAYKKDVSTADIDTITTNNCPGAQTNVMPTLKMSSCSFGNSTGARVACCEAYRQFSQENKVKFVEFDAETSIM